MRILLIGRGFTGVEGAQLEGFSLHEKDLAEADFVTRRVEAAELADVERTLESADDDVAIVMIGWNEPVDAVIGTFSRLKDSGIRPRLVFLDYYASTSSPFFGVVPYVDVYAKRQVLRDRAPWFAGDNFVFADWFAKQHDFDLKDWWFGSKLDRDVAPRVTHAWNLGIRKRYLWMLRAPALPWAARPIDVHCRLAIGAHSSNEWTWYQEYRSQARKAVEPLGEVCRLTPDAQVRRGQYFAELASSKIGYAPFGWGEVCIRDFEAIALGALLVKPSMDHVLTSPNIYVANETYVPVKWDLSDLVETCRYYLDHPREAQRIVTNARHVLLGYLEGGGFVRDVRRVTAHG